MNPFVHLTCDDSGEEVREDPTDDNPSSSAGAFSNPVIPSVDQQLDKRSDTLERYRNTWTWNNV